MGTGANFEQTSALRVSVILVGFVILSVVFEKLLHWLDHWFEHMHKEGLKEVLDRLKDEILLVGFLSLLLLAMEDKLLTICMSPTTFSDGVPYKACHDGELPAWERRLGAITQAAAPNANPRRLAGEGCEDGMAPFVSASALHQTHILIFLMAAIHISFCAAAMFITEWRAARWNKFEQMVLNRESSNRVMRRLRNQVPAVYDKPWKENLSHFFGQFWGSVNCLTYVSLRNWFIAKHQLPSDYAFHDYIMRCIHKDFSETMGVRWWMWLLLIVNVLSDGYNFGNIALPTATIVLAFAVGTKLHGIAKTLTRKCFELHSYQGSNTLAANELAAMYTVSDGRMATLADVFINDKLFWFGKPWVVLMFIQMVMFQNALELAMSAFYAWQVGTSACFFDITGLFVFIRLGFSGFLLFHNALVMLPCYSLVVQMGSRFNHEIVTDEVRRQLKRLARGRGNTNEGSSHGSGMVNQFASTAKDTMDLARQGARSLTDRVARSQAATMLKDVQRRLSSTDQSASFNKTAPARTSQRSAPSRENPATAAKGKRGSHGHTSSAPASQAAGGYSTEQHTHFQGHSQVERGDGYDHERGQSPMRDQAWNHIESEAKMPQWVQQDGQWSQPWQQQLYGPPSGASSSGAGRYNGLPSVKRNRIAPLSVAGSAASSSLVPPATVPGIGEVNTPGGYGIADAAASYVVGEDNYNDPHYYQGADYHSASYAGAGDAQHVPGDPAADYNDNADDSFVVDDDEGVSDSDPDGEGSAVFVSDRVMGHGSSAMHVATHSSGSGDADDDDVPPPPPTPGPAAAAAIRRY